MPIVKNVTTRDSQSPAASTVEKAKTRQAMLLRRAALSSDEVRRASEAVQRLVFTCPEFQKARAIHCYLSFGEEIQTAPLFERCHQAGVLAYAPFLDQEAGVLGMAPWQPGDAVSTGAFGVPEPAIRTQGESGLPLPDVVLVPGLAFDQLGNRLGYGKGYYDRFLARLTGSGNDARQTTASGNKPVLIGLAYEFQVVDSIPRDPWDIPMDIIATECGIIRPPGTGLSELR